MFYSRRPPSLPPNPPPKIGVSKFLYSVPTNDPPPAPPPPPPSAPPPSTVSPQESTWKVPFKAVVCRWRNDMSIGFWSPWTVLEGGGREGGREVEFVMGTRILPCNHSWLANTETSLGHTITLPLLRLFLPPALPPSLAPLPQDIAAVGRTTDVVVCHTHQVPAPVVVRTRLVQSVGNLAQGD